MNNRSGSTSGTNSLTGRRECYTRHVTTEEKNTFIPLVGFEPTIQVFASDAKSLQTQNLS